MILVIQVERINSVNHFDVQLQVNNSQLQQVIRYEVFPSILSNNINTFKMNQSSQTIEPEMDMESGNGRKNGNYNNIMEIITIIIIIIIMMMMMQEDIEEIDNQMDHREMEVVPMEMDQIQIVIIIIQDVNVF